MNMLKKFAETIEMSISIPDDEKKVAKRLILNLERIIKKLNAFNRQLDIMYNPFKEFQTVSAESVEKYRGAIWRYKEQLEEIFNSIKKIAILCVRDLSSFESDTHITELLGAFSDDIGGLEEQINHLYKILINWDTGNYKTNVVSSIELVKKEISELRKLIYERLIDYINSNILSKSWVDEISNELNIQIKEKQPLILQLYKEREEQLNKILRNK